jgi:hypothetical protein
MTPELIAVLVTALLQFMGLCGVGVMVYRQGIALAGIATAITRLGERVSPGEAAIILQQQRLATRFEDLRREPEPR